MAEVEMHEILNRILGLVEKNTTILESLTGRVEKVEARLEKVEQEMITPEKLGIVLQATFGQLFSEARIKYGLAELEKNKRAS